MSFNKQGPLGDDVHSYANFKQVRTTHIHLSLNVDFKRQILHGYADIDFDVVADDVKSISLDTRSLSVEDVVDRHSSKSLGWIQPNHHEHLGVELRIPLEHPVQKGAKVHIRVFYSTTNKSAGIQWFAPEQTAGKKHPYMYTQCEAILARTLLPCQDVPAVKAPYSIRLTCPSPLVAACSGVPVGENPKFEDDGNLVWEYKQENPIPAYLIAIVCGALKKASVGPRSSVWCEKELIDAAVHEFSADTEKYVQAGEEITGLKYEWGVYDMVVLPPAFPYGGMENPNLTFLSSSLLSGDRSLTSVVAHEITHSWAGNYTTNSSWSDFWLNEGFCVYVERMILGKIHNSLAYRDFESLLGYYDLVKTCEDLAKVPEYTKLTPNLVDIDPDEAFSKIPYEKGSLFLRYLEHKVGGLEKMQRWLKQYFHDFRFKSLCTEDMKKHFLHFFEHQEKVDKQILDSIEWDKFLKDSGLPPFDPNHVYDKTLTEKCISLANKWIQGGKDCHANDITEFQPKQKMYFLEVLIKHAPVSHEIIQRLEETYHFSNYQNVEIVYRYLMLSLKSKFTGVLPQVAKFLSSHGRGLYVRPLYKALNEVDHEYAKKVFHDNKAFYHVIIRNAVGGMIGI